MSTWNMPPGVTTNDIPGNEPDEPSLIGRYCPERGREAREPGGQECAECGCIFIGAEWHALCKVCHGERQP